MARGSPLGQIPMLSTMQLGPGVQRIHSQGDGPGDQGACCLMGEGHGSGPWTGLLVSSAACPWWCLSRGPHFGPRGYQPPKACCSNSAGSRQSASPSPKTALHWAQDAFDRFQLPGKTGSHSAEWRVAIGSSWVITSGLGSPWAPMGHHGPLSLVPQGPPGLLTDAPGGRGDPMASVQRGAARCAFFSCRAEIKMQEPPRLHTTWAGVPGRPPMSLNLRICKGRVALAPCLIDLPLHPRPLVGWLVREVSW